MYKSLKQWIDVPAQWRKFISYSGSGLKTLEASVDILCYPQGHNELLKDEAGNDIDSKLLLYVDSNVAINNADEITFNGITYEVKSVAVFYRAGTVDLYGIYV